MSDGSITRNQFANLVQNSSVDADTLATRL
jgi:hypothetical protein